MNQPTNHVSQALVAGGARPNQDVQGEGDMTLRPEKIELTELAFAQESKQDALA